MWFNGFNTFSICLLAEKTETLSWSTHFGLDLYQFQLPFLPLLKVEIFYKHYAKHEYFTFHYAKIQSCILRPFTNLSVSSLWLPYNFIIPSKWDQIFPTTVFDMYFSLSTCSSSNRKIVKIMAILLGENSYTVFLSMFKIYYVKTFHPQLICSSSC